jgi:hypothetical protein
LGDEFGVEKFATDSAERTVAKAPADLLTTIDDATRAQLVAALNHLAMLSAAAENNDRSRIAYGLQLLGAVGRGIFFAWSRKAPKFESVLRRKGRRAENGQKVAQKPAHWKPTKIVACNHLISVGQGRHRRPRHYESGC